MDVQPVHYDKTEYVETATGNKVNRKSKLYGSQNIILNGKVTFNGSCSGDLVFSLWVMVFSRFNYMMLAFSIMQMR